MGKNRLESGTSSITMRPAAFKIHGIILHLGMSRIDSHWPLIPWDFWPMGGLLNLGPSQPAKHEGRSWETALLYLWLCKYTNVQSPMDDPKYPYILYIYIDIPETLSAKKDIRIFWKRYIDTQQLSRDLRWEWIQTESGSQACKTTPSVFHASPADSVWKLPWARGSHPTVFIIRLITIIHYHKYS